MIIDSYMVFSIEVGVTITLRKLRELHTPPHPWRQEDTPSRDSMENQREHETEAECICVF